MPYPSYVTDCPHCGAQLQHHVGPSQDAPWQCMSCHRGWWTTELTPGARRAWRPFECDHLGVDLDTHLRIVEARHAEVIGAHARRTSAREDHLPFLDVDELDRLATFLGRHAEFHPAAADLHVKVLRARKQLKPSR